MESGQESPAKQCANQCAKVLVSVVALLDQAHCLLQEQVEALSGQVQPLPRTARVGLRLSVYMIVLARTLGTIARESVEHRASCLKVEKALPCV